MEVWAWSVPSYYIFVKQDREAKWLIIPGSLIFPVNYRGKNRNDTDAEVFPLTFCDLPTSMIVLPADSIGDDVKKAGLATLWLANDAGSRVGI